MSAFKHFRKRRHALLLLMLSFASTQTLFPASAQSEIRQNLTETDSEPQALPVLGPNFTIDFSGDHTSNLGWDSALSPTVSWRFSRLFSLDAGMSWYPSVNAYIVKNKLTGATKLETGHNVLSDTSLAGHFELTRESWSYMLTTTVALPTGNSAYGQSANQVTYNFTNHYDHELGIFTPEIEIGIGDNSGIAGRNTRRTYTAVGTLANFKAGTSIDLPFHLALDLAAYEELPVGNQNVYGTKTNKKGKTTQVFEGVAAAEDNGFVTEASLPLTRNLLLNGSYSRSLRQGVDTAQAGITFTLRTPRPSKP